MYDIFFCRSYFDSSNIGHSFGKKQQPRLELSNLKWIVKNIYLSKGNNNLT